MSRIIPIPTTRVGDLFIRQRQVSQVQFDQLALFRLQNQISTGQRIQLPSEDAPAALRAINLQRLLDRKGQIRTNLKASNQYLSAAWDRLGHVSTALSDLRGSVVGVAGTVVTDEARQAVIQEIDSVLQELVSAGNAKYQGRYLFAGSRSQDQPYDFRGEFVEFAGNEGVLRSYVDLERLFDTNLSGTEVFGGISAEVQGSVDLDPHLTASTLVSTVNGGGGIGSNPGISVSVTAGGTTETSVVDLSTAVTMADVARLIEDGAPSPAGANVTVEVTSTGLVLRTDGDSISVAEVAEGRAAQQLGILANPGGPMLVGGDLNPALLKTTRLENLLGKKAQLLIESAGANNDILLTASTNGNDFNGVTVEFIPGGVAGSEVVTYDDISKTLTVQVQAGASTANQVAASITLEGTFTAVADYHDALSSVQVGSNPVEVTTFTTVTSGGSGDNLDTASGLILTNGGETVTLDISTAETVEDLLNLINSQDIGLVAEINASATGINVRSRLSGADFTIGENGGTTAAQLGIRTYTGETELAAFNRGVGVTTTSALETLDTTKLDALTIVARDGTNLAVNLAGSTSLQDVVDAINTAPGNFVGTTAVLARLTQSGNGIELVDSSTPIAGALQVQAPLGTDAAEYLGLVPPGETQHSSTLADTSGNYVVAGSNVLGHDLMIQARDNSQVWIDLAGATTVDDVLDRINAAAGSAGVAVTARLAAVGNGIEIVDATVGAGTLAVNGIEGSPAAEHLGFIPNGAVTIDGSGNQLLQSEDRHTLEADSAFNTLLRLRTALENADVEEIGRSLERLDADLDRVNFARAELGGRIQNLDVIGVRLQDEDVQLRSALSQEVDVDIVQAISDLTARQFAFQASLQTTASMMRLSLLDFI